MSITRLSGGLTPGDGSDPRTFPEIFNGVADTIESQGSAITDAESDIDDLEAKNIPAFGTATPSDGQVLTFDSAGSEYVPEDVAASLEDLTDTSISSPATGEVLEYDGTNWVNAAVAAGGKILQVVSETKTDTFTYTGTSGFVDVTGLSASITPSSTSSKVLCLVTLADSSTSISTNQSYQVSRNGTSLGVSFVTNVESTQRVYPGFNILDEPGSTSTLEYQVQVKINNTSRVLTLNLLGSNVSSITLMEVAA